MLFGNHNAPEEMTEEQRRYHEQYVKELNAQNRQTVKKVCTILWCVAMACWVGVLIIDVVHQVGYSRILFHAVAAALTAVLALRRVVDFFTSKKKRDDDDTEA